MKIVKIAVAALLLSMVSISAQAACPTFSYGKVLTPGQWQQCFDEKQAVLGYNPVNKAGDVMTGRLVLPSPTGAASGFNITPGSVPSAPIDGDIWTTSSGVYARISGSTVGPLGIAVTSGSSGGIPYFNTTTTQASSGTLAHYGVVYGGGVGGSPVSTAAGALDQVFMGSATAPSFVSVGDCSTASSALTYSTDTHAWGCNPSVVSGPASSTNTAIARYSGTGGKTIQNSSVTVDGSGNISGVASISGVSGAGVELAATNTDDNASSTQKGYYVESSIPAESAVALTNVTYRNFTSITLAAGDWQVGCNAQLKSSTATGVQQTLASISTSPSLPDDSVGRTVTTNMGSIAMGSASQSNYPQSRFLLSSSTTLYCVVRASFSGGSMAAWGILWARRER